jgi:hypothetical protein
VDEIRKDKIEEKQAKNKAWPTRRLLSFFFCSKLRDSQLRSSREQMWFNKEE